MSKSPNRILSGRENGILSGYARLEDYAARKEEVYDYLEFWAFDLSRHGIQTTLAKHLKPMIDDIKVEQQIIKKMCEYFEHPKPNKATFFELCRKGMYDKPIAYRTIKDDFLRSAYTRLHDPYGPEHKRIGIDDLRKFLMPA